MLFNTSALLQAPCHQVKLAPGQLLLLQSTFSLSNSVSRPSKPTRQQYQLVKLAAKQKHHTVTVKARMAEPLYTHTTHYAHTISHKASVEQKENSPKLQFQEPSRLTIAQSHLPQR